MPLRSVKISEATPLIQIGRPQDILIPIYAGDSTPKSLTVEILGDHILERVSGEGYATLEDVYTKSEVDDLLTKIPGVPEIHELQEIIFGGPDEPGSMAYQINEAKQDLIGSVEDQSSYNTINAAKNLVAESLQFITYN